MTTTNRTDSWDHPTNTDRQDKCVALVRAVRANDSESNAAFEQLLAIVNPLIRRLVWRYSKPGLSSDELYSEALYVLRYCAVERYRLEDDDGNRSPNEENPASVGQRKTFPSFARLCIESRLISYSLTEGKKQASNVSLFRPSAGDGDLASSITANRLTTVSRERREAPDPSEEAERRDEMEHLQGLLFEELSPHERSVYDKVSIGGLSYEAAAIALGIDAKAVDNALIRIRAKGRRIYEQYLASRN